MRTDDGGFDSQSPCSLPETSFLRPDNQELDGKGCGAHPYGRPPRGCFFHNRLKTPEIGSTVVGLSGFEISHVIDALCIPLVLNYRRESRIRDRNLREDFAWLNRYLLSLLKQHRSKNSIVGKRRGCAWKDDFLLEVLTGTAP